MQLRFERARQVLAGILVAQAAGCGQEPFAPEGPEPPSPPPIVIDSPAKLIEALTRSYQLRDDKLFASLLADDPDRNAEYLFLLSEPTASGETQWGYDEEARIHRRMFHPERPLPGEVPVPEDVRLQSLSIHLSQTETFSGRPDLYSQDGGADGKLDPAVWRATGASYTADLFFDLSGDTDYTVDAIAKVVVIENRTKNVGDPGKFLILIWEDVVPPRPRPAAVAPRTWGGVKSLYR